MKKHKGKENQAAVAEIHASLSVVSFGNTTSFSTHSGATETNLVDFTVKNSFVIQTPFWVSHIILANQQGMRSPS